MQEKPERMSTHMENDSTTEKITNLEAMVNSLSELLAVQETVVGKQSERIRKDEVALRESEGRYRSLVETTSDWVWEVDENGAYTYVSPQVFDLIGYTPEEVLGKTPFDFMPPEEAARVGGTFGSIIVSRKLFSSLENANRHKDGHIVVLETSGVPAFRPDGTFSGYRGIDRDITGRKRDEEALKESNDRFITFIKEAAMRLKNPMEVVEQNISIVVDDVERGQFDNSDVSLQLKIQIRNLEQIRQNIIELNKVIVDHSGNLSEASRKFLTE